jgi:hypothetical protein
MDHIQVANGAGMSIAHIGHSSLAGSSIYLKNILHVPRLSTHLLSVNHLCWDNDAFVEFHCHFSVLRTMPRGKFFFTVEVKAVSTRSLSAVLHPLHRTKLSLVLWLRPLSGISVLVIPQIM